MLGSTGTWAPFEAAGGGRDQQTQTTLKWQPASRPIARAAPVRAPQLEAVPMAAMVPLAARA
jgi:hypothetical protein